MKLFRLQKVEKGCSNCLQMLTGLPQKEKSSLFLVSTADQRSHSSLILQYRTFSGKESKVYNAQSG